MKTALDVSLCIQIPPNFFSKILPTSTYLLVKEAQIKNGEPVQCSYDVADRAN